ncbi:hypothetical protein DL771_009233 [Monosporascus sp. 5C6A]|nr:hypothetical protein DL771_009233 [Monosporascus sp. 5C6A]
MSDKRGTIRYELSSEGITVSDAYQPQDTLNEKAPDYEAEHCGHGNAQKQDDGHKLLGGSMVVGAMQTTGE